MWAGSHDASQVTRRFRETQAAGGVVTAQQLFVALNEDLEFVPFEVFALRLRRFLQNDLAEVLAHDWRELPWHVDNRCRGCDYLGMPWINAQRERTDDPGHCIPTAVREDRLSRVAFISRGASLALQGRHITGVAALAVLSLEMPHLMSIRDCGPLGPWSLDERVRCKQMKRGFRQRQAARRSCHVGRTFDYK